MKGPGARQKLIAAAEALMLSKGYPTTTVDEICAAAGVSKGSFYHFFRAKEDLGLAVLDAFHTRNGRLSAEGPHSALTDPKERALALVDHLIATSSRLWGHGCLLGGFALDLSDTSPVLREAVSERFHEVAKTMAAGLAPVAADGGVPGAMTADELAEQFIVVVEGALILAKAHKDWSYVTRALDRFRDEVRRNLAEVA